MEVENVNDNQPKFDSNTYTFTVMENITEADVLGYVKVKSRGKFSINIFRHFSKHIYIHCDGKYNNDLLVGCVKVKSCKKSYVNFKTETDVLDYIKAKQ